MTTLNSSFKNGVTDAPGDVQKAFEAGCRKLSARMRTEKEIRDFLKQSGFEKEATDEAVEMLKEYRYLDDERYCKEYFRYAKTKGKADARIIKELAAKGISALPEFLERQETDDRDLALQIGKKMARQQFENGKDRDEKFFARVGRRLAGLGYDSSTIYSVLGKLRQDERDRKRDYERND